MLPSAESETSPLPNTLEDKARFKPRFLVATPNECDTTLYFPLPLRGEIFKRGKRVRLLEPFTYQDAKKGIVINIPAGFESDYNTVPRGLWNLFPPWEYPEAAIIHDWLYKHPQGFYKAPDLTTVSLSRLECDNIHRRILELLGANWTTRQAMWAGIRAGGFVSWSRYRNDPTLSDSGKGEPKESQNLPPNPPITKAEVVEEVIKVVVPDEVVDKIIEP